MQFLTINWKITAKYFASMVLAVS